MSMLVGGARGSLRVVAPFLCAFVVTVSGCGWSDGGPPPESKKLLKAEDLFRTEGKGKNKHKVSLSRSERAKLRFEARKKLESQ